MEEKKKRKWRERKQAGKTISKGGTYKRPRKENIAYILNLSGLFPFPFS